MKKYRYTLLVCIPLFTLPLLLSNLTLGKAEEIRRFHLEAEMAHFQMVMLDTTLPNGYNYLFAGSGVCQKCHGYDTLGVASVDAFGEDVNVVDDWKATMMANSAKDPFWRAKVSHEVLLYPQHQAAIEDKCTSCHASMGHFNAKHLGAAHYAIAEMVADPLAMDGVSCLACHMQSPEGIGFSFSGELKYDTFKVAYGPYMAPLVSPMLTETGYKPKFSPHVSGAGICAGCHTLMTETLDFQGNTTGNKFVEQATYHEWLNSVYNDTVTCQGCHMPNLDKWPVHIVTGAMTEPRNPFFLHELTGGNVTMLKLLQDNIGPLGITAGPAQFDEVIEKTMALLQNKTLQLDLQLLDRDLDTARFSLKLTNMAGHKFPSGYPSRRAFVEFVVENEAGDTIFVSGKTDGEYEVFGQNPTYEPHYQVINSEEQVQIYEMVMGDVNGDVTTVLTRADHPIKDNRLPPAGFTTTHPAYDTTIIAGDALSDPDFNHDNGTEGSGSDMVYFHIPTGGETGLLHVSARVFYQSAPPKWMDEMFGHNSPEIDAFRTMFDAADRTPVLIKSAEIFAEPIVSSTVVPAKTSFIRLYPTPTFDGRIFVESSLEHDVQVFDPKGRLVRTMRSKSGRYELHLQERGVFLVQFKTKNGRVQTENVVVQ
ncbi:MAG: T9SS type A sorting domain-containing protein [Bacteroidetes bacterium]|nr:T9SS type A sorting domain-containing protein [Bacteroidota bacterium]